MKKSCLILILCFYCFNINAQSNNDINIGKIESIYSKILNEERKVWIHVPKDKVDGVLLKQKYPVIYLLDGDAHFSSVVGMIENLSSKSDNNILPKCIIVGITNTNRSRDLTPKKEIKDTSIDSTTIANFGGGEKFISFIEKELIPKIESEYPTAPHRMFIGHSLGGLLVMHTLITKPNLFNAYIAIDPAMWWDNQKLLNELKNSKLDGKFNNKTLFLGVANTLPKDMDINSVEEDESDQTFHIRSILKLNVLLSSNTQSQLKFKGKYYENDTHGSSPLISTYDALRFIFDFYDLKIDGNVFYNPETDVESLIVNHFKKVSKTIGYGVKPYGNFINKMGNRFLDMKQLKKAEALLQLNVTNFPENHQVYNSLGNFYEKSGDKEKAIKNYKKSISLNKDSLAKDKLKVLEKE
ncbi:alpha/beta hydrolase-fold protein [Flavivirga rizhaonensis]|uniref:Tetratricopeptide repeat protein n=1 Tax=Flavivirga rizhaonensis TaxID=2559571 RepID=A0A4S1E405_9FLAO|nr:alpha/beta hydrolase-fold protein [Flavivirga rizhaonensis]TGV04722.1 tetratricopeptide repeat protein [Flavivirga rizhaonensis]